MNPYIIPGTEKRIITAANIRNIVEQLFDISPGSTLIDTRQQRIVIPRQIAMYFTYKFTPHTYISIGKLFGRDHSTVVYACRMVRIIIEIRDPKYIDTIIEIENTINNLINNNHYGYRFDRAVEHSERFSEAIHASPDQ